MVLAYVQSIFPVILNVAESFEVTSGYWTRQQPPYFSCGCNWRLLLSSLWYQTCCACYQIGLLSTWGSVRASYRWLVWMWLVLGLSSSALFKPSTAFHIPIPQFQQLHSEIRRCIFLPSRSWSRPSFHCLRILLCPPISTLSSYPSLLCYCYLWILHWSLSGWHTAFHCRCELWCSKLCHYRNSLCRHQTKSECRERECLGSFMVHQPT